MHNLIVLLAIFATWFVLMRWVLPSLGFSTCCCMGDACRVPRPDAAHLGAAEDQVEQLSGKESER